MFKNSLDVIKEYKHLIKTDLDTVNIDSDTDQLILCLDFTKLKGKFTINVKENVKAKVVELLSLDEECEIEKNIVLGENAQLELVSLECAKGNNNCVNVKTFLNKNSYINTKKISLFDGKYNSRIETNLNGEFSSSDSTNVLINSCGQIVSVDEVVNHNASDTVSILYNYGICRNVSTLNMNTNGYVVKDAKRSNLRQKSKGILLDELSAISANPWLQIDEFDCLASHGAGIGAIDEEDLYYLMSRGLSREESERLIINGFVNPVYEAFPDGELKEFLVKKVKEYL